MNDSSDGVIEAITDSARPILDRALEQSRYGLRIFPVNSVDKSPLPGYAWKELASSQTNHVVEDFQRAAEVWGEDNTSVAWALGLDNFVAIDLDVPKDDWPEWVADIIESAALNITKRGTHLIFRNPDEFTPGNTDTKFPTSNWGEVRGAGGYIVTAGPDRPGLDVEGLAQARKFPHPEWLAEYGGGAEAVSWPEVKEFALQYDAMENPNKLTALKVAIASYDTGHDGNPSKGRHPYGLWLLCTAARESAEGLYPFKLAYSAIKEWWEAVTPPERHGRELRGMAAWAVATALQNVNTPTTLQDVVGVDGPDTLLEEGSDPQNTIVPLDWQAFWNADRSEDDWFIEGFWPRGRAMVVHAKAKEGKSEFVLFCICCLVQGIDPWTGEKIPPKTVCYFDYEMTEDDLLDRLIDMGFDEDCDLSGLKYYLLPPMRPLDTPEGAAEIMAIVERDKPDAIVIDTFGRAVQGEEDEADTVRDFYRLTGQRLKAAGVGYLRTDHTGKDAAKGQRGSSAKNDDVDIIWSMQRTSTGTKLTSRSRVSWVPEKLELIRRMEPVRYERIGGDLMEVSIMVTGKACELDQHGIPTHLGRDKVRRILIRNGLKPGKLSTLSAAIKLRRSSSRVPAPVREQVELLPEEMEPES